MSPEPDPPPKPIYHSVETAISTAALGLFGTIAAQSSDPVVQMFAMGAAAAVTIAFAFARSMQKTGGAK